MTRDDPSAAIDIVPSVLRGAAAGLVAGIVASFVMDRFQAALSAVSSSDSDAEPATSKAAGKVMRAVAGDQVAEREKPLAGQIVHYALGAGLGIAYGIAAEFRPQVTAGHGGVFGLGVAATLDEAVVPAVGLGPAPWKTDASTHLYTLTSHLIFGVVSELTRKYIRSTWLPDK